MVTSLVAMAVGLASLAGCGRDASSPEPPSALIPGALVAFQRPATASDTMPAEVVTELKTAESPEFTTRDIQAARRMLPSEMAWLVPARNGEVCLVQAIKPLGAAAAKEDLGPTTTRSCSSARDARAGRLVVTQALTTVEIDKPGLARVVGVAPTDATQATILSGDGRTTPADLDNGAYVALARDPVAVRFTTVSLGRRVSRRVALTTFSGSRAPGRGGSLGAP
jgi:hypothetical protein